ncbi:fimbrial protein [Dyella subtropica]|uniref:fimbrial protein n=1 Tax=Dyella subtropica TaxID=2992127 RepID=UPI002256BBEB|nr:fimbrial protein [Dyella subtropica]
MKSMRLFHESCLVHRRRAIALLAGLIVSTPGAVLAQAGSAAIGVTGVIGGGACAISTNPVDLGAHDASEFTDVGSSPSSGWVNFPITSQGCSADIVTLHMGFDGNADTTNKGLFAITGGARGIGIQLQTQDGSATVVPNSTTDLLNWTPVGVGSTYPMRARYVQTLDAVTPGAANSVVTVMLSYN